MKKRELEGEKRRERKKKKSDSDEGWRGLNVFWGKGGDLKKKICSERWKQGGVDGQGFAMSGMSGQDHWSIKKFARTKGQIIF